MAGCMTGCRGPSRTFLCCWRTPRSGRPMVWLMGSCWIWGCLPCRQVHPSTLFCMPAKLHILFKCKTLCVQLRSQPLQQGFSVRQANAASTASPEKGCTLQVGMASTAVSLNLETCALMACTAWLQMPFRQERAGSACYA